MIQSISITAYLTVQRAAGRATQRIRAAVAKRGEAGQASAEYALVLLAAAGLAILLGGWLVKTDTVQNVFKKMLESILGGMTSI